MEFELQMTVRDGEERHRMLVGFGDEEKGEVLTSLASPLLTLLLDVIEEGISGGWDNRAVASGGDQTWSSDTVETLRPLLERYGGSWLRYFKAPVEVVPLEDLYDFATAFDEMSDPSNEWRDEQASLIVLLASAQVGKNIDDLVAYTGLPLEQVSAYAERLWLNGVWEAGKAYWPNLGHGMVLVKDSMVAEGLVARVRGTDAWKIADTDHDVDSPVVDQVLVEMAR